jgi:hypothetical protein
MFIKITIWNKDFKKKEIPSVDLLKEAKVQSLFLQIFQIKINKMKIKIKVHTDLKKINKAHRRDKEVGVLEEVLVDQIIADFKIKIRNNQVRLLTILNKFYNNLYFKTNIHIN